METELLCSFKVSLKLHYFFPFQFRKVLDCKIPRPNADQLYKDLLLSLTAYVVSKKALTFLRK